MTEYVEACLVEIEMASASGELAAASSVFFGGGTPSRLPSGDIGRLLDPIPRVPGAEVTVECNPEDVTRELMTEYRACGVNRISLGAQSTVTHVLADLGRRHGATSALDAARIVAEGGFDSWSMDLILGARSETDSDWEKSLSDVLGLADAPPHLSVYSLTVEPGTPLAADPLRHPDDDVQAHRYERTDEVLTAAGYQWEEISNWALPGHECRHNQLYWSQGNYRGIGSGAHSHENGRRWWNVRTPDVYISRLGSRASPMAGSEVLTPEQRHFEQLLLALRTPWGAPEEYLPEVQELEGLVDRRSGRAVLTLRGRLLANVVTLHLRDHMPTVPHPYEGTLLDVTSYAAGILR